MSSILHFKLSFRLAKQDPLSFQLMLLIRITEFIVVFESHLWICFGFKVEYKLYIRHSYLDWRLYRLSNTVLEITYITQHQGPCELFIFTGDPYIITQVQETWWYHFLFSKYISTLYIPGFQSTKETSNQSQKCANCVTVARTLFKFLMFVISSLWKDWYRNRSSLYLNLSVMKLWEFLPESAKLFGPYFPHLQSEGFKPGHGFQKYRDNRWHKGEKILTSYMFILTCAWKNFS